MFILRKHCTTDYKCMLYIQKYYSDTRREPA
jgi:hypothetical protein